jgi:hypothetical protein
MMNNVTFNGHLVEYFMMSDYLEYLAEREREWYNETEEEE